MCLKNYNDFHGEKDRKNKRQIPNLDKFGIVPIKHYYDKRNNKKKNVINYLKMLKIISRNPNTKYLELMGLIYDFKNIKEILKDKRLINLELRLYILNNFLPEINDNYFYLFLDLLGDEEQKIRRSALKQLKRYPKLYYKKILPFFVNNHYRKRYYLGLLLSHWFPNLKGLKWYKMIRKLSISDRESLIFAFSEKLFDSENDEEKVDLSFYLEKIGDFRSITFLKYRSYIVPSQLDNLNPYCNDYDLFLLTLAYEINPSNIELRSRLLNDYFSELLKMYKIYDYNPVFLSIFYDLGLKAETILGCAPFDLETITNKLIQFPISSWGYISVYRIISSLYPMSYDFLIKILNNNSFSSQIEKDIISNTISQLLEDHSISQIENKVKNRRQQALSLPEESSSNPNDSVSNDSINSINSVGNPNNDGLNREMEEYPNREPKDFALIL